MAVMVSIAKRQRIALSIHNDFFENAKLPFNFAKYIDEEIEELFCSGAESV